MPRSAVFFIREAFIQSPAIGWDNPSAGSNISLKTRSFRWKKHFATCLQSLLAELVVYSDF